MEQSVKGRDILKEVMMLESELAELSSRQKLLKGKSLFTQIKCVVICSFRGTVRALR